MPPGPFNSNNDKEKDRARREAEEALERGELPPTAITRINEHLARGNSFFSTDLSVREFMLTREAGIQPISQVMGTCFYSVSWIGLGGNRFTGELRDITQAQIACRRVAVERMLQEARLLGATGVIGVRIQSKRPNINERHAEFTAFGTAVRIPGYPAGAEPFASDLNGQDFWQLYKAGYRPAGLVMGACSYYVYTDWYTGTQQTGFLGFSSNQEVQKYTQCFTEARNSAMYRLQVEMAALGANGCVGMTIDHEVEDYVVDSNDQRRRDLLINFYAMGTAVKYGYVDKPKSPLIMIDLRKNKPTTEVEI